MANLRAVTARRSRDQLVTDLTSRLLNESQEFAILWARKDVAVRRSDRKRLLLHPTLGELELNCLNLLSDDGMQRLLWFHTRPGEPSRREAGTSRRRRRPQSGSIQALT